MSILFDKLSDIMMYRITNGYKEEKPRMFAIYEAYSTNFNFVSALKDFINVYVLSEYTFTNMCQNKLESGGIDINTIDKPKKYYLLVSNFMADDLETYNEIKNTFIVFIGALLRTLDVGNLYGYGRIYRQVNSMYGDFVDKYNNTTEITLNEIEDLHMILIDLKYLLILLLELVLKNPKNRDIFDNETKQSIFNLYDYNYDNWYNLCDDICSGDDYINQKSKIKSLKTHTLQSNTKYMNKDNYYATFFKYYIE